MTLLDPGKTILCNVHIRSGGDPLTLKLRLARLLDAADFQPAGLPADATLVVRHMGDPLPGSLRLEPGALLPSAAWERAMQQALETQARRAARPALGPAPADAPAVLFADRAELLFCLAADWLAGRLPACWWWRSLFPNADLPRAVQAAWAEVPEELPAAFELLARCGQAAAFVRALDVETARQMLFGLARCFGLTALEPVLRLAPNAAAPDFPAPQRVPVQQTASPSSAAAAPRAPWHSLAPESAAEGLSVEQQSLLGIALTLRRAPTLARSAAFSAAVHAWRQRNADPVEPAPLVPAYAAEAPGGAPDPRSLEAGIDLPPHPGQSLHLPDAPPAPFIPSRAAESPDDWRLAVDTPPASGGNPAVEPAWLPGPEPVPAPLAPPAAGVPAVPAPEGAPLVETIFTQFGGLFHLLNLALILGIYGDFSAPLAPGLALSPWDFMALLGRKMLGPPLEADPLWTLLARLAGRHEGQPPGAGFEPPDGLTLREWLEQTVAQIRLQLLLMLGLEQQSDLCALLFAHPARIEQSASRLDIFFSLAEHPIQIRMAGLDRDPWWIPAAGRFVVYHYD